MSRVWGPDWVSGQEYSARMDARKEQGFGTRWNQHFEAEHGKIDRFNSGFELRK
jgi:hypothetical protein